MKLSLHQKCLHIYLQTARGGLHGHGLQVCVHLPRPLEVGALGDDAEVIVPDVHHAGQPVTWATVMRRIPGNVATLIPTLNARHSLGQLLHPEEVVEHVLAGLL